MQIQSVSGRTESGRSLERPIITLPDIRYGMVWYGIVWYGMVWYGTIILKNKHYYVYSVLGHQLDIAHTLHTSTEHINLSY